MTSIGKQTRALIVRRDGGICVACGLPVTGSPHIHHRKARGMGGSKDRNRASNLILLHPSCHLYRVETKRAWAIENGWLVEGDRDPAEVPVRYRLQRFVLIDDEGNVTEMGEERGHG